MHAVAPQPCVFLPPRSHLRPFARAVAAPRAIAPGSLWLTPQLPLGSSPPLASCKAASSALGAAPSAVLSPAFFSALCSPSESISFCFLLILLLAVLGLCCCIWTSCSERSCSPAVERRLLSVLVSLGFGAGSRVQGPQQLQHVGSAVMAHGLSCSEACGIFPDQGSNSCPLHWQADSQALDHKGSPRFIFNLCVYHLCCLLRKLVLQEQEPCLCVQCNTP